MEEKMKAAFDAKWPRQYGCNHRYYGRIAIDWALKYLREQQEPTVNVVRNAAGQVSLQRNDGKPWDMSRHIGQSLYANPVPESEFNQLREAAREFYNATVASQINSKGYNAERHVVVSATHPELRDRIDAASDALEAVLKATAPAKEGSQG